MELLADTKMRARHRISKAEYDEMASEQNHKCFVCGGESSDRKLAVDHDHECCPGVKKCGDCIRALLCFSCNIILGHVKDDPERLRLLAEYIEWFRGGDRA
jgi:hypothetical protein